MVSSWCHHGEVIVSMGYLEHENVRVQRRLRRAAARRRLAATVVTAGALVIAPAAAAAAVVAAEPTVAARAPRVLRLEV